MGDRCYMTADVSGHFTKDAVDQLTALLINGFAACDELDGPGTTRDRLIRLLRLGEAIPLHKNEVNYAEWTELEDFVREHGLYACIWNEPGGSYRESLLIILADGSSYATASLDREPVILASDLKAKTKEELLAELAPFEQPLPPLTLAPEMMREVELKDGEGSLYAVTFSRKRWQHLTVQIRAASEADAREKALALLSDPNGEPDGDWDDGEPTGETLLEDNIEALAK